MDITVEEIEAETERLVQEYRVKEMIEERDPQPDGWVRPFRRREAIRNLQARAGTLAPASTSGRALAQPAPAPAPTVSPPIAAERARVAAIIAAAPAWFEKERDRAVRDGTPLDAFRRAIASEEAARFILGVRAA